MDNSLIVNNRRKRLKQWINDHCGGSQSRFIDSTGINQGELSALLKEKSFGEKKARKLELQADMPNGYLDIIDGSQEKTPNLVMHAFNTSRNKSVITIKQFLDVGGSMGTGIILQDQPGQITSWTVTEEWLSKNIPHNTGAKNLYIITGFGNSMVGMFNPGDPLVIDAGVKDCKHDGVYFFRVDNEGFVKILQRIPGQGIRVISKNLDYEPWTITPDMDFEVLGKVLRVWESTNF